MRGPIIAVVALALAACGQPPEVTPADPAAPAADPATRGPAWLAALTATPDVVRTISLSKELTPLNGTAVTVGANGALSVKTPRETGAWTIQLIAGAGDASDRATAYRIKLKIDTGYWILMSKNDKSTAEQSLVTEIVGAGEEKTLYLPLDKAGVPVLIVANGLADAPSTGTFSAIDLVAPPAAP